MKSRFLLTQAFVLLTAFAFGTACNGPVRKDLLGEKVSESRKITSEHPKLTKTVGDSRSGNVQCSMQDKAGNLWFGTTQNGLYKYDGKSFGQFTVSDGLNSDNISCVFEDKDGIIWIGTAAGLCRYDGKAFAKIEIPLPKDLPPNKSDLYRDSHWVFNIIQAKSGELWFATIDGVYVYDGKSFAPFVVNKASGGYMSSNNNVEFILEDKAGNIWFGGRGNEGVYRYDGKAVKSFKLEGLTLQFGTKRVSHNWAWPQLQDKNGNIWFSNWAGAYRYDGKKFTSVTKSDGLPGYNGLVVRIIEDKNGDLLFGGDAGLSRYDGKSFTSFKDGLINPWIWTIQEDKAGGIWVGTREAGLYLFDGKTFVNYSE